jgi:pilus assembly protein CpaC
MALSPAPACAVQQLRVIQGQSIVVKYPEKIETVSLASDSVADVTSITSDELIVIGKIPGVTSLVVWGASLNHTQYLIKVDRSFSGRQVLLEVEVGEIKKSKLDQLGLDVTWSGNNPDFIGRGTKAIGSFGGETGPPSIPLGLQQGMSGYFKFVGTHDEISAAIHALEQRGDIKLLAKPKLLCLSGENASFLSGGEIPVPVAQGTSGGGVQVSIQWKEYGVRLNFVPTVIDSDLINLRIKPEVSSLDYSNGVVISGFAVPALITRRAEASVELNSGQTMLLGGLVSTEQVKTVKRVPILGHIPLIGALFTRRDTSAQENELVIIVSPRIVGRASEEAVPPVPWDGKSDDEKKDKK